MNKRQRIGKDRQRRIWRTQDEDEDEDQDQDRNANVVAMAQWRETDNSLEHWNTPMSLDYSSDFQKRLKYDLEGENREKKTTPRERQTEPRESGRTLRNSEAEWLLDVRRKQSTARWPSSGGKWNYIVLTLSPASSSISHAAHDVLTSGRGVCV